MLKFPLREAVVAIFISTFAVVSMKEHTTAVAVKVDTPLIVLL